MKYTTASLGRVLVLRLEDGDTVHASVEEAARAEGISRAAVIVVGGAGEGSRVVVGPEHSHGPVIEPMERTLQETHEMVGAGTLFPDGAGEPVLHLHASFGRDDRVITGCIRRGVKTWVIGEVVVIEIVGSGAHRRTDEATGFELLEL